MYEVRIFYRQLCHFVRCIPSPFKLPFLSSC